MNGQKWFFVILFRIQTDTTLQKRDAMVQERVSDLGEMVTEKEGSTLLPSPCFWFQSINDRSRIHIHRSHCSRRRRDVCSNRRNLRSGGNRRIHRSSRVPQVHHRQRFRCFRLSRFALERSRRPSSHTAKEPVINVIKALLEV